MGGRRRRKSSFWHVVVKRQKNAIPTNITRCGIDYFVRCLNKKSSRQNESNDAAKSEKPSTQSIKVTFLQSLTSMSQSMTIREYAVRHLVNLEWGHRNVRTHRSNAALCWTQTHECLNDFPSKPFPFIHSSTNVVLRYPMTHAYIWSGEPVWVIKSLIFILCIMTNRYCILEHYRSKYT